jgi:hypothetical protein
MILMARVISTCAALPWTAISECLGVHLDLARLGDAQPARHQLDIDLCIVVHEEHLYRVQERPVGAERDDA